MIVERVKLRDFRSYEQLDLGLPPGTTLLHGANGAGKTNLLEAIYMGTVGRSCRTNADTRVIRFGAQAARVELTGHADGEHRMAVSVARGQRKSLTVDGSPASTFEDIPWRPLAAVFMPDRLELVKGAPGLRRAHFDQVIAALWPARRATRRAYAAALAQRNALVARGDSGSEQLHAWERQLAEYGYALTGDRTQAIAELQARVAASARQIGLEQPLAVEYRPSAAVESEQQLLERLEQTRADDVRRGFTTVGPHRDDFRLTLGDRELRAYGSQGQQRAGLLALLLAEVAALTELSGRQPLVLLDDVMSELDGERRTGLLRHVAALAQCIVTTTDISYLPDLSVADATFAVVDGTVREQ